MSLSKSDTSSTPPPAGSLPDDIDTPNAKLVYLYLQQARHATVDELRDALNLKLLTLYPVLTLLAASGYVVHDGDTVELR